MGEAPGEKEDFKGLPFIGPSGYLLDALLVEAGFDSQGIWFTNPYKTRPPNNEIGRLDELGIPRQVFLDQILEELTLFKPTIIVACGKTPTQLLCPDTRSRRAKNAKEDGFGNWRGSLLTSPLLNWPHYVIPMYHPAYVLRNYEEKEICVFILTRAFEEIAYWKSNGSIQPLPTRRIMVNPSFDDATTFLKRCISSTAPISIDIELLSRKVPYTVSFALSPWEAVSMSYWNYPTEQLRVLWRQMDEILATKAQIGQNYTTFDAHWLRALGFRVNLALVHDTLIRHHVLWPELPHRLQYQTMQYTREPYYKEEGKSWSLKKEGLEKLMRYNCKDTLVTYEIFLAQEVEFRDRQNTP
jgi:uracil-DNA glycosylase family 4